MWLEELNGKIFSPLDSKVNPLPGNTGKSPQMSCNSRKPALFLFRDTMKT